MSGMNKSLEFEASIDESGKISVPESIAREIGAEPVHVRLTSKVISSELRRHDVSEEEIARLCNLQLESREQILKFLLSEGVLGKGAVRRRVER